MNRIGRYLLIPLIVWLAATVYAAPGKLVGEKEYDVPDWFKFSFLELQDDVREASQADKHVMLFLHIDRCPYCTALIEENFRQGSNHDYTRKHFDVIAINIRGDREIAWDKNTNYTEKSLAKKFGIFATPTVLFLNGKGEVVYKMHGYRKPPEFGYVLHYVAQKQYKKMKLADYVRQRNETRYTLRDHPQFVAMTDFSRDKGPLMVLFEDRSCAECDEFHREVLLHKSVMDELNPFKVVRLDAYATTPIVDNNGNRTTPMDWARALKLDYRPGTVLFDKGKEISRVDGRLYHFHYKEMLRYVSTGAYRQYASYIDYLGPRQKELLQAGVTIDVSK
jgi:thioredoxin-related protein